MGKAVQDPGPLADPVDGPAVILLVQEKSRLLSILNINDISDTIFRDPDFGIKRLCQETLVTGQAFFFTHFGITPLIDSADHDPVRRQHLGQGCQDQSLDPLRADRQGLHDQHILVFVDRQTRQEIRFSEDDPAAGGINDMLAIVPGRLHPFFQESSCDPVLLSAGEDPDPDP